MTFASELNFSRRKRLPVVLAAETAECALACMAMIGRYHGHDVDLNGLRQRFSFSIAGASLRSLMALADQMSFSSRPLKVGLADLDKVKTPAILHWDLSHFVVLKTAARGFAVIHDPAAGLRKIPWNEVSNHYTGVVLELEPAVGFERLTAKAPMQLSRLWSTMSGLWGALGQILVLSLLLQIVTFALPFQIQLVVDEGVLRGDGNLVNVLAIGFCGVIAVQATIELLRGWSLQIFGQLFTFQISGNIVRHLLRLPSEFFEKRHVGDILSRMGSVARIQDAVTRGVASSVIDGLMALVAGLILFFYSGVLALVVFVAVALNTLIAFCIFVPLRRRQEEQIFEAAKEQSYLMETIRAVTTIKLMGREAEREGEWRNLYAGVSNASVSVGKYQVSLTFFQTFLTGIQTVAVIYLGARAILSGDGFSIGMLFAFLSFRQTFTDRANALIDQMIQFRVLGLHVDRLGDIVTARSEPESYSGWHAGEIAGGLTLEKVSFRYGVSDPVVLADVNLTISPGEFIAITGASGEGKTTLLKLMLGLAEPTTGVIKLDDHQVRPELWRPWREQVGVVAQDDRLMSGTIADNIAFFDPDLDMDKVREAAKSAQVHADITRMPMQYLSLVGDMGSALSGGQRQRVLLARALYRNPRILFLDEGTANLDEATEQTIADLIAALPITRIVVAHRPALIQRADRVFIVENCRIEPSGTSRTPDALAGPIVTSRAPAPVSR